MRNGTIFLLMFAGLIGLTAPSAFAQRHNGSDVTGPAQGSGLVGNSYAPTPSNTSGNGGNAGNTVVSAPPAVVAASATAVQSAVTSLSQGTVPVPPTMSLSSTPVKASTISDVAVLLQGANLTNEVSAAVARLTTGVEQSGSGKSEVQSMLNDLRGLAHADAAQVPVRTLAASQQFNEIVQHASPEFLAHPSDAFIALHATLLSIVHTIAASQSTGK
jgi:hypothetical protein